MGFKDVFKKSFLEGFTSMDISAGRIMATFAVTRLMASYISDLPADDPEILLFQEL